MHKRLAAERTHVIDHAYILAAFAGTGTTLAAAEFHGRSAIGIDLDERNRDLWPLRRDEVFRALNPTHVKPIEGQLDMFGGVA